MTARARGEARTTGRTGRLGVTGRLVMGGTLSTGLLLGGFVVTAMTLAGRMNGGALLPTSVGLFLGGAAAGLLVTVPVALWARPRGTTGREAARDAFRGVLYAVPACLFGAFLAGWMGMVVIGLYLGTTLPLVGSALAALIALGIMAVTFDATCDAAARLRH